MSAIAAAAINVATNEEPRRRTPVATPVDARTGLPLNAPCATVITPTAHTNVASPANSTSGADSSVVISNRPEVELSRPLTWERMSGASMATTASIARPAVATEMPSIAVVDFQTRRCTRSASTHVELRILDSVEV